MILNEDTSHSAAELWSSWLGPIAGRPGINFLEVGSWEGQSTVWFLRNILSGYNSRITCVDTWMGGGGMPELAETNLGVFLKNVAPWLGQINIVQARSEEGLAKLTETFHVIYIDGSHEPWDVLSDSVLCWRLLNKGGLMIWDDYKYVVENHTTGDPRTAIDCFLACNPNRFKLIGEDYQLCIQKL